MQGRFPYLPPYLAGIPNGDARRRNPPYVDHAKVWCYHLERD